MDAKEKEHALKQARAQSHGGGQGASQRSANFGRSMSLESTDGSIKMEVSCQLIWMDTNAGLWNAPQELNESQFVIVYSPRLQAKPSPAF